MRNNINILGNNQRFSYIVEYIDPKNSNVIYDGEGARWSVNPDEDKHVYLLKRDLEYYRNGNEWFHTDYNGMNSNYMPEKPDVSTIRVYMPTHSVDTYGKNIKYVITANTWINGHKIELGSSIFRRVDTLASETAIKNGNIQYFEYFDMIIFDPYAIMYTDDWSDFRKNVCNEPDEINNTGALINISLYVVYEYDSKFIMSEDWIGGYTSLNICDETTEYLKVDLSKSLDPLGWKFYLTMNNQYCWTDMNEEQCGLLEYLNETYGIDTRQLSNKDIKYEIVLKSKDSIIPGPMMTYSAPARAQYMEWSYIKKYQDIERSGFYKVFESWDTFEEGWFIAGSLNVYSSEGEEILSVVSNQIPLTQEVFKYFVATASTNKVIDASDMEIINYSVINKIENKIVNIERQENSKSNIIQPVFFKVKDTEKLTIHPVVTENICINLDDYKSKVDIFRLQIEGAIFDQIGVNQYGVLFKIIGSALPNKIKEGTYYVLNENSELVTTGKYKYVS